jgi:hypothetical protein
MPAITARDGTDSTHRAGPYSGLPNKLVALRLRDRTAGRPYIPRTRRDDPSTPEKKRRNES